MTGATPILESLLGRPAPSEQAMPPFTWEQLTRQLTALVRDDPILQEVAATLAEGTRKQASCKPPEAVLQEILKIAEFLTECALSPDGEGAMG